MEKYKPDWKKLNIWIALRLLLMAACLWLIVGCSKDDDDVLPVQTVLLVYLAGDNNLSPESHAKLQAIASGYGYSNTARILVYQDASNEAPSLMEIDTKNRMTILETYEEENSASAEVFSRVIVTAKERYPEASFNLLVFSHGTGWLPEGSYANPSLRSILVDGQDEMDISDFASAIPDRCFDYIIFEACYMAGIEVAYELRNKANYIAASSAEIVSPGFTDVYQQYINDLAYGDPKRFMREAFDYFNRQTGYMQSATFSIIQTDRLDALATFVGTNCDFTKEVQLQDIQNFDRKGSYLFGDLEDYYSRLLETEGQKQDLQKLISDCVIWKAATPYFMEGYNGFAIHKHSGLTAYIKQKRYSMLNTAYQHMEWYKAVNKD